MGVNRIKENTYKKYRSKRNLLLFFLIVPTLLIISTLVFFYKSDLIKIDTLVTIYLPLLVIDFIVILNIQPKLMLTSMHCDYSMLMLEEHQPKETTEELFTKKWLNDFLIKGFKVAQDYQSYILMYQYNKKLKSIGSSDETMVFVIIAKNKDLDFYSEEIDRGIQSVYLSDKKYQRINKQIAIQFKKYEHFDEKVKEDVESVILFKSGKQRIIHLTVGYLQDSQSVYCICPEKRFPNKYVFYACQEIKNLSYIKE